MELAEIEQQWRRLDAKLNQTLKLESEILRQAIVAPARRRIDVIAIWPMIDIAFCVGVLWFSGAFAGNHWGVWSLVAPAIVVMTGASVLMGSSIQQLVLLNNVDWSEPVAEIQSQLTRVRMIKLAQFKWSVLCAPLVGFCAMIVILQTVVNSFPDPIFILDKLHPWWIGINLFVAASFIALGPSLVQRISNRLSHQSWWKRLADDISGITLRRVQGDLDCWSNVDQSSET